MHTYIFSEIIYKIDIIKYYVCLSVCIYLWFLNWSRGLDDIRGEEGVLNYSCLPKITCDTEIVLSTEDSM